MATTFLNITESSLNFKKLKKINPKNSNLKSFWAFLFSVFIYISAFYFFNLSLSTLLCTTKFWFFISNTLIIILAADFGDFSSSKENDQDSHEELEYVKSSTIIPKCGLVPSLEIQHVKTVGKTGSINHDHHKEEFEVDEKPEEKIIDMIYSSCTKDDHSHRNHESEENKPEMIIFLNKEKKDHSQQNPSEKIIIAEVKNAAHEVGKRKGTCIRSNSDKGILTTLAAEAENEEKIVLQRTLSEKREEPPIIEEKDEYSNMSDEELNRRVEEFIRRFNRQIRLQATNNRQNFQEQHLLQI